MNQYDRDRLAQLLRRANRIVVKVGTNLIDSGFRELNRSVLVGICSQIGGMMASGRQVILVSSGAIGSGLRAMDRSRPCHRLEERQALAAIGQCRLMETYEHLMLKHDIMVAQVLLTRDDLEDRKRYVNAKNTLENLIKWRILPIVNENDTVAVEELKFGDNDTLSAVVANKVEADLLVILTDVDGLFYVLPKEDEPGQLAEVVETIDDRIRRAAGKARSHFAIGGMRTKVDAAEIATQAGTLTAIANGKVPDILPKLLSVSVPATWFLPHGKRMPGRKRWILGRKHVSGSITVDFGARKAVSEKGKSLLPSGVWEVRGEFESGSLVEVCDPEGKIFARGLSSYSSAELSRIKGKPTTEIRQLLQGRSQYAAIHRDDLVLV